MAYFNERKTILYGSIIKAAGIILACIHRFVRRQGFVTAIMGPEHRRDSDLINIDITYECNLRCVNCNRSCAQAPTKEYMTIVQVKKFVDESIHKGIRWKQIIVEGGEPTLHPDLLVILNILLDYKKRFSPRTLISITSNGTGSAVNNVLKKIPKEIIISNNNKGQNGYRHWCFNCAPVDSFWYKFLDFSNGCSTLWSCGMGLTPYGYYCCTMAGGIDRIFGFDMGRKVMPEKNDLMTNHLKIFCGLCGHFKILETETKARVSPLWKKALIEYSKKRPKLSLY